MLDAHVRPFLAGPLDRLAALAIRWGWSAHGVTAAGFGLGLLGCVLIAADAPRTGLALILFNRLLDGIDGAVARRTAMTDLGGFLDILADFLIYAAVPFAFAVREPAQAMPAAFLMLSFVGTGTSFLAYAAVAARRGIVTAAHGPKAIYYLGGLAEGSETIFVFVLMGLRPDWFAVLAYGFGALCWVTTAGRVWSAIAAFGEGADVRAVVEPPAPPAPARGEGEDRAGPASAHPDF